MTDSMMISCPKGCGASVHRENIGFHVCLSSKEMTLAEWREKELTYVIGALATALELDDDEQRDALCDIREWAKNRLKAQLPIETLARHLQPRYVLEQIMNNSTDPWAKGVARTCLMGSSVETKATHAHVWMKAPDSELALCVCGDYSEDWYCPKSPDHVCHYKNGDLNQCDFCGQPEERK